jgi:hypothetical protein
VRSLLREFAGRKPQPTAMIVDSHTLQSTPESGARAGYDGVPQSYNCGIEGQADWYEAWALIAGERIKLQLFEMGKPFVAAYEPVLSPHAELVWALWGSARHNCCPYPRRGGYEVAHARRQVRVSVLEDLQSI